MVISCHCLAQSPQFFASLPVSTPLSLPYCSSTLMMEAEGLSEALAFSTKLYGVTCQKTFPTCLSCKTTVIEPVAVIQAL